MSINTICPLCGEAAGFLNVHSGRSYYECPECYGAFLDSADHLDAFQQKQRYEQHNNDVNDLGYQKFVSPIVDDIRENFSSVDAGLDFGCGTGPVITKLLRDHNYNIAIYDPFFCNDKKTLHEKYKYIICCEVIEHFDTPYKDFRLLRGLLKEEGVLYCKTEIFHEDIDFKNWYYKNDPTHVFFYHKKTLEWIRDNFNFASINISGRMIKFFTD